MDFEGKVVLLTGASAGIGEATAKLFAKYGASLSLTGRNEKRLEKVAEECRALGAKEVLTIIAEFSRLQDVENAFNTTIRKFSRLNVLVNNVGTPIAGNLANFTPENFDTVFNVNVKSALHLTRLAMPYLVRTKGNVVNVSSIASTRPLVSGLVYGMTKAALDNFTKTVALEYASKGVRVNSVNPGFVKTSIMRKLPAEKQEVFYRMMDKVQPMGRSGYPEEIANAIVFLASNVSLWTTGHCLVIDGGTQLTTRSLPKVKSKF